MGTKTQPTAHGEIEYETVECDSCGTELLKDEAFGFIVFDQDKLKKSRSWNHFHEWNVYDGGYKTGWACPYCYDAAPVDFPRIRSASERLNALYESVFVDDMGVVRYWVIIFVVVSILTWTAILVGVMIG